jgi:hypothetical protein
MSIVEVFRENSWHKTSWHKNVEYAIFNAEVMFQGQKLPYRVVDAGKIVYELGIKETEIIEPEGY